MELGEAKYLDETTVQDHQRHPIWFFSIDSNGEQILRPLLGVSEITESVLGYGDPHILLNVEGTQLFCAAYYDHQKEVVYAVALWMLDEWRGFTYVDAPRTPITLTSLIPILGKNDVKFIYKHPAEDSAVRVV